MMSALAIAASIVFPATSHAQMIVKNGYEAFPLVEYRGGDATQPKRRTGVLVLTDSTLAFHECTRRRDCLEYKDNPVFAELIFSIPLRQLKEVSSSTEVRGPGVGGRIAFGVLATDRKEEFVGVVYETEQSAEAPVFRTQPAQAAAIEAKVRFRLKKLGIQLTEASK